MVQFSGGTSICHNEISILKKEKLPLYISKIPIPDFFKRKIAVFCLCNYINNPYARIVHKLSDGMKWSISLVKNVLGFSVLVISSYNGRMDEETVPEFIK